MSGEPKPAAGRQSPDFKRPNMSLEGNKPATGRQSPDGDRPNMSRIVLLGKTGAGRSASGNTILGEERFHSERSFSAVTTKSEVQQAVVGGRLVSVVDTPGLFDTDLKGVVIASELARSIHECRPGPHALLIVMPLTEKFTQQEKEVTNEIRAFYGEEALKYAIILFTYGDQLEGLNVEDDIKANKDLNDVVSQCGGRYHVFNNKDKRNRSQVTELLEKIDKMVDENGGGYYSNKMLEDALRCRAEGAGKRAVKAQWEQKEKNDQEEQQKRGEIERAKREESETIKKKMEEELQRLKMESQQEIERLRRELTAMQSQVSPARHTPGEVMRRNLTDRQSRRVSESQGTRVEEGSGRSQCSIL